MGRIAATALRNAGWGTTYKVGPSSIIICKLKCVLSSHCILYYCILPHSISSHSFYSFEYVAFVIFLITFFLLIYFSIINNLVQISYYRLNIWDNRWLGVWISRSEILLCFRTPWQRKIWLSIASQSNHSNRDGNICRNESYDPSHEIIVMYRHWQLKYCYITVKLS